MVVRTMNINKLLILITLIAIVTVIGVESYTKINNHHYQLLNKVINKEIKYQALLCYRKKECKDNVILLKELYERKYLTTIVDPQTEKVYNENSYVTIDNNQVTITLKK